MPKSKKRKLNHGHHSSHRINSQGLNSLSHEEIWDDSALLRSWNDAVAEYEYYHSIHAHGEDVEEVLRKAEEAEQPQTESVGVAQDGHTTTVDAAAHDQIQLDQRIAEGIATQVAMNGQDTTGADLDEGEIEDGEIDEEPIDAVKATARDEGVTTIDHLLDGSAPLENDGIDSGGQIGPSLPPISESAQELKAQGGTEGDQALSMDQSLENIKMAYYWAGYYSGLYDAQRQAAGASNK